MVANDRNGMGIGTEIMEEFHYPDNRSTNQETENKITFILNLHSKVV